MQMLLCAVQTELHRYRDTRQPGKDTIFERRNGAIIELLR